MMVTFVSQCQKKALNRTRRVLDAFADRIGDNTWQTVITEEGLITVKKLLRKTATKNTAVSCHWIRSRSRSELVWVVGDKTKFNAQGIVPVNSTENEITHYKDSHQWKTLEIIKYAAAIAGLFHDFGKANVLFQEKLSPRNKKSNKEKDQVKYYEPYRHEWVSLRIFQAFVGKQTDQEWFQALTEVGKDRDQSCFRDGIDKAELFDHPIIDLPPFAQLVAWLILTHHKLPLMPSKNSCSPGLSEISYWFEKGFEPVWNSFNCKEFPEEVIEKNWTFHENGLPYQSNKWRSNACVLASEASVKLRNIEINNFLHDHIFTSHLARLALMLADHHYSAKPKEEIREEWRAQNYAVYANTTDRKTRELKQQLDEHLIGVAYYAKNIVRALPKLNASLKQLSETIVLDENVPKKFKKQFGWQDDAKKLASQLSEGTLKNGFFGINMASTGTGKTLANAKIMYALGEHSGRKRFSVALGLRALTLQTGREYRKELNLNDEQLAIAVGGTAVKLLFENEEQKLNSQYTTSDQPEIGSQSAEDYLDPDLFVDYHGEIYKHSFSEWTSKNERIEKLIQAPVLVCTIDHLIPATEGTKGGKQIGPMLRLLTSDLIIDEPDDFGLEDLPALCRLVHWAGMLGSRVLLSTATMPPALAYAAFEAYQAGWEQFAKANIDDWKGEINCAWFDEFNCVEGKYSEFKAYQEAHNIFAQKRTDNLKGKTAPKRKGYIAQIKQGENNQIANLARTIHHNILQLHQDHHLTRKDKHISIGLVRMANINPLVAVAKNLLKISSPDNTMIHYCVYHSRYPLAIRSHLEGKLDSLLKRHDPDAIWQQEDISKVLNEYQHINHHIFVVLASPVAEVGRDHDYDWAVVEPSSMRSIIQLAGRILRHRKQIPTMPNVCLLNQNYRSLKNESICFKWPGFESEELKAKSPKFLQDLIPKEQYDSITAISKIVPPENVAEMNLIGLEHKAIAIELFGKGKTISGGARVWWKNHSYWCGEVQRQQRFRNSQKDEAYYLILKDEYSDIKWQWKNEDVYPARLCEQSKIENENVESIKIADSCKFWFDLEARTIYPELAKYFGFELSKVGELFGEIRLVEYDEADKKPYYYQPNFGVYQEVLNG